MSQDFAKIALVYFSKNGATNLLAQHIRNGAISLSVDVTLFSLQSTDVIDGRYHNPELFSQLAYYDAIIFGSPTYMGSPAAQFKAFMDASSDDYTQKKWRNKLAAGFTTGGSINGEQQQTLLNFFTLACQHGMLWVGLDTSEHTDNLNLNRTGSSIGLVASPSIDQLVDHNDLETAFYFGQRIARLLMPVLE